MDKLSEIMKGIDVDTSKANMPITSNTEKDVCPHCKGAGYLRKNVPVDHPDFGQLIACECKVEEMTRDRMQDLRDASHIGLLDRMTFDSFIPEGIGLNEAKRRNLRRAYERALSFAEAPEGWLIFKGNYGCGKTHLAAAIANYRLGHAKPALFIVVPDLLDHLRATFNPANPTPYDERFETVRTAPLLILDDLGTQSETPWAQEKLYQIFNHRYNAQLPTVITTNRELEEIDERLRSRMADPSLSTICTILAPDFRQSGAQVGASALSILPLLNDMTFKSFELRPELPPDDRINLKRAHEAAKEYAQDPEGWLALSGPHGSGKTHLAAAVANYRERQGESVMFVVVPDLLDELRASFHPTSPVRYDKRFEEVRRAPFLVLDDLGTESATPWAKEKLFQLINHRYLAELPTVITTAVMFEELDPHLATRILDFRRCTAFAIHAPSYSGGKIKKRHRRKRQG